MLTILVLATALGSVIYASFFEWGLHRYVMHKPLWRFRYPFEAHALTHHVIFKADHTYHLQRDRDKKTIPMAWWNGPALVVLSSSPFILVSWLTHSWWILPTFAGVVAMYYATYEYLHWCMHLPLRHRRLVERSWIFYRLNGHHLLHHRYMNRNFNVVLPLADLCLGTLLPRSPTYFNQPVRKQVPDVQPRQTATTGMVS